MKGRELADKARALLEEKKAKNIKLLDVRELSTVTDYFLIVSGMSTPHLKAMFSDLQVELKKLGSRCYRKAGNPEGGWMVLDYVDVIIHLFMPEMRQFYAIEELWGQAAPEE